MLDHGCFFGVRNKPSLMFLESLSAFQKWSWFINHYFKYSRFNNSAIWWPRIAPNILMFLESFTECQKSNRFINFFLRYCWFENPAIWLAERIYNCAQITFTESLSAYQKSSWFIILFLRYNRFKKPGISQLENQNFPRYAICASTKHIIWTFIQHKIEKKLTTKFWGKTWKPLILPVLGPFCHFLWKKRIFVKNWALLVFQILELSTVMQKFEKTNEQLLGKTPNSWTERQHWIHRSLLNEATYEFSVAFPSSSWFKMKQIKHRY